MEIKKDLELFGLNETEQKVYLLLCQKGWSTVLGLSKSCPIKRTTLYRILLDLVQKGLAIVQVEDKTTLYNASSPDSFSTIIKETENKTSEMKLGLEHIKKHIAALSTLKITETSLRYYKGLRGLKQMEWKILEKTNIEIPVFDSDQWKIFFTPEFCEDMRQEAVKRNIRYRSILNQEDTIAPDGTTSWTPNKEYLLHHYRHRLIAKKILDIKQDLFFMPDSIFFRGIRENDVVAVEIINSDYAAMMKQSFELIWSKARAIDRFGNRFK